MPKHRTFRTCWLTSAQQPLTTAPHPFEHGSSKWVENLLFYSLLSGQTEARKRDGLAKDLEWLGVRTGQGPQIFCLQGLFAVSCQTTAWLVICQEKKEQAPGLEICWRDKCPSLSLAAHTMLHFVLQQKSLVYISVPDQDIWLSKLYGLERCSSCLEGKTITDTSMTLINRERDFPELLQSVSSALLKSHEAEGSTASLSWQTLHGHLQQHTVLSQEIPAGQTPETRPAFI